MYVTRYRSVYNYVPRSLQLFKIEYVLNKFWFGISKKLSGAEYRKRKKLKVEIEHTQLKSVKKVIEYMS